MASSISPASVFDSAPSDSLDLRQLAVSTVERALASGAADAEAVVAEGDEFEALIRMGEVERLKESGSRAIGIRVYFRSEDGTRTATTSSTDFSEDGIARLVAGAVELAKITTPDPFAGLPETEAFGSLSGDLEIYHDDVYSLPPAERIQWAKRAEASALTHEPTAAGSITNSKGAGFDAATGHKVLANSRGFVGEYRRSYCSIDAAPIAETPDGKMQRDHWYSSARSAAKLESPESVGREAARRALRRLGAKPVATQQVPIVLSPEIARSIVGHIFEAASGSAIYHQSSFFLGMLGKQVAAETITVIDDGTIVGGFGTSPFDGEGLPTRRTVIVENGVLKNYLLNTYMGRKLGMASTGNASRGLAGTPGIGSHNLFLTAGTMTPEALLSGIPAGLYVTELIGQGVNMVTGDYSRGASGLWIENGELTYPVEEITIAGNLKEMLKNISAIADDLVFRGSVASPTLSIDGMVVAGG
jgi:PmbA protein